MIDNLKFEIFEIERTIDRKVRQHAILSDELDELAQELETKRLVLASESCELTVPPPRPTFIEIDGVRTEIT